MRLTVASTCEVDHRYPKVPSITVYYIIRQNTVYLSIRIQYIYRSEYSIFIAQNTMYLAARIEIICCPE